ncbi:proline-rich protein 4-like [Zingiber officinale]|uniref:proline-rich protein 4-like n=1 Tax=Zingiber officinale TaxID=94328 RepID=UPI001C4C32BD|nr:proline-rich protein 4-like [Zingiber officinale]
MGTPWSPIWSVFGVVVLLLVAASCSSATTTTETWAVGSTECLDCAQKNIKSENAAKGLRVVVQCKVSNEKYETKSVGAVDGNGNFNVKLPSDLLQTNGELKQECFMQLHNAPNAPCPDKNGLTSPSSKLILKSKGIFTAAGKLSFASATCVFATFLPPYSDPWHKKPKYSFPPVHLPPLAFPPKHDFHHHHPIYTPPTPTYKPAPKYNPPSGGYYNPPTPTYKPVRRYC